MTPTIAVLGLGNLMRTDDALGMLAIEQLREYAELPAEVRLIEGGTLGLDLLHSLWGITHLVAIDAVDVGSTPGTLVRFSGPQIADLPVSKSVHLLGFSDLIGVMRLMNAAPEEIVLLGVQPESTDWGTELTSKVKAAQESLLEAIAAQVADWLPSSPSIVSHAAFSQLS